VVVELLYRKPHAFWWGGPDTGVARLLVKHVRVTATSELARKARATASAGTRKPHPRDVLHCESPDYDWLQAQLYKVTVTGATLVDYADLYRITAKSHRVATMLLPDSEVTVSPPAERC
jgi:hypothetical protein